MRYTAVIEYRGRVERIYNGSRAMETFLNMFPEISPKLFENFTIEELRLTLETKSGKWKVFRIFREFD